MQKKLNNFSLNSIREEKYQRKTLLLIFICKAENKFNLLKKEFN